MTCNSESRDIPSFDQASYGKVVWCTTDETKKRLRDGAKEESERLVMEEAEQATFHYENCKGRSSMISKGG